MTIFLPGYKDQQFRIAREASYGTAITTGFKRLENLMLDVQPKFATDQFIASGDSLPSINILNDDYTEGDFKGKAGYESMQYLLSSFYGDATITTPGGGSISRQWDWSYDGTQLILPASYTVLYGVPSGAEQVTGVLFNGMQLKGSRKGMDISGKLFGQKVTEAVAFPDVTPDVQTLTITGTPTGGTFALTYKGAKTAPIAYNAAPSAVQSALQALPTVQTGNFVCAGTSLPGGSVTITAANLFYGATVGTITADSSLLTGGSSPTASIAHTTPGADTTTAITPQPMFPLDFSIYMDTSWGALGGTKLTQTFELDYNIGEKWDRTLPINSAQDSDSFVEKDKQKHTLALTLACDATERGLIAAIRAGTTQFIRIEAVGRTIESSIKYLFRQDLVAFVTDADKGQDMGSVYVRKINFQIGKDPSTGNAMSARVINTRTSL